VPTEHRERIWFPDFTTKKRGTGLGLALVRQTVQAHGGSVELLARESGACFVVRLPVNRPETV
jgi:signal transduction histidine kinase